MTSLRRTTLASLAVASVGLLGACTSQPSAKAVAKDVVESITLPPAQEECMLEVIDKMPESELEALGEANVDQAITNPESGTPEMQRFVASLQDCQDAG